MVFDFLSLKMEVKMKCPVIYYSVKQNAYISDKTVPSAKLEFHLTLRLQSSHAQLYQQNLRVQECKLLQPLGRKRVSVSSYRLQDKI